VGTHLEDRPEVVEALRDRDRPAVLLWPGPGAADLATSPPEGPVTLFAVDGTWSLASKLLRLNPSIAALPRYAVPALGPSEYRIRREPRAECLSTIEALARALGILEGDPAPYLAMLEPFRAMVEVQLAYQARGGAPRDRSRLHRRVRPTWAPPRALADPRRVLVVAVEANGWPLASKADTPDELVHCVALRGDGSERFERVVAPDHPLAPSVERHTGLTAAELRGGTARASFLADFAAFLREGDVLASWGTYAPRLLRAAGLARTHATVDLRRVAADWLRASPHAIERCVADLGLEPPALGPGRGGRRLGLMFAMFEQVLRPSPAWLNAGRTRAADSRADRS
jgi:hypothetical protein